MSQKKRQIRKKYRKKSNNFSITTILFLGIAIYLSVHTIGYLTKEKVRIFEVEAAEKYSSSPTYTGVISREETIYTTENAGYINYYIREGKKASDRNTVYKLDQTGQFANMLADTLGDIQSLSKENLKKIKEDMIRFSSSFDPMYFKEIYDEKNNLSVSLIDSLNMTALENLGHTVDTSSFQKISTDKSGLIVYRSDNYEGIQPEEVTLKTFDKKNYSSTVYLAGELWEANSFAYKLVKDDTWTITFPLSEEDMLSYNDKTKLSIYLKDIDVTTTGNFSTFKASDGTTMGKIELIKYGSSYCESRFVDFTITEKDVYGIKVPKTSVVSKSFYTIPKEYITKGGNNNKQGVNKEVIDSNGNTTIVFVPVSIFETTDTEYYIDSSEIQSGDVLIRADSQDKYQISVSAPLDGVYNANKGYSIFRRVEILAETKDKEYYIVSPSTKYGIEPYDHIVLNSEFVVENQSLY